MRVKKDLKDLDATDLELPEGKSSMLMAVCVLIIEDCRMKSNC